MAIKKELIQFTIINSTDCDYNIPMFQQNVYSINSTTKYSWDVTTADLSCGTGTIIVNSIIYPLSYAATLSGLLSALNALGFGFFCSETISGSTYIYVVDDTNIYGDLDLCPTGTSTTTTTTTAASTSTTTTTTTAGTSTTTTTTTAASTSTTTTTTTAGTSTTTTTTTVPSTSTTTTTTTAPSTTSTTSTTTTLALGECYQVQNTQGADIGIQFYNTSNVLTCNLVPDGATVQLCVFAGTGASIYPWTNTDCTGSLASAVITSLVSNCVDASTCLTGTTTSTTTTTTTAAATSTTTSTTTVAPTTSTTTTTTTVAPTSTTTSTTSTTTTAASTTSTTSTTTTLALGECYQVQNTQGADIGIQFYNTSNVLTCNLVPDGATVQLCVFAGTGASIYPWTNTDCTGSLASAVITSLVSNCVDASTCLTGTTTSTTTTTTTAAPTTTSTTTTTTTLLDAPLRVENTLSLDISVSNVSVNSVTATPLVGSYPVPAGENRDLTTTQFGTYDITVSFTNTITGQRITVTDSNGVSQCQTVNTSSTFTYTNCAVDGLTQVLILCEDGACGA